MSQLVAIVTGASRGIGLATALRLARRGHAIVAAARTAGPLADARRQLEQAGATVRTVTGDVATADAAHGLVDAARELGELAVLVNNVGAAQLTPLAQMSDTDYRRALATNVDAVFFATRAVWPVFCARGGGIIVNVSSVASADPFAGLAVYGACKAWVNLFTLATAREGAPHGIRAYGVAPGAVETVMLRGAFPDFPAEQTLAPDDVAGTIDVLCGPELRYASGQTIFVRR